MTEKKILGYKLYCHCGCVATTELITSFDTHYLCEVCLPNYQDWKKHYDREQGKFGDIENLCFGSCSLV